MSYLSTFSHIYVEQGAGEYPLAQRILSRFPKASHIAIQNYKEVFNRPRQSWEHQRNSLKMILAVRDDAFLYPGSSFVPHFDHSRFFYTTPVLNCLYGCEYCYLQGMFPSANIVVFVNSVDFISAASRELVAPQPAYLCISYDTDLLALENILGYCAEWVEYARSNPHVTLEIRTKSANIAALQAIAPAHNVIMAWTLSPEYVITTYEHRTPSLAARVHAIARAQELGWRVRLCFDPILRVQEWERHYTQLVEQTFPAIRAELLTDVSLGVFRIPSGYLRAMQENNPRSKIAHYPYTVQNKCASYTPEEHTAMISSLSEQLARYIPQEKICPVPWQL